MLNEMVQMYSPGIIQELFVLIPEEQRRDPFSFIDDEEIIERCLSWYIESLIWRKPNDELQRETIDQIRKHVICRPYYFLQFIKNVLIVCPVPQHPFNADWLHRSLLPMKMADRDTFWVQSLEDSIDDNGGSLSHLVQFCIEHSNFEALDRESKRLIALTLGWSFATTNVGFREKAIPAAAHLLENDFALCEGILSAFAAADDPYVLEGVYNSIYGAVLRSSKLTGAEQLADCIYRNIFSQEEVFSDALVRAHATGIIQYFEYRGINFSFDIALAKPPYRSRWYDEIPTQEKIESYKFDYKDKSLPRDCYGVNAIIHSMTTNSGVHHGMYGDFGRYIFEGLVRPWSYHFSADILSNLATQLVFEKYGYDYKKHGRFDQQVKSYSRQPSKSERIGKKYQRISTLEVIAKLSDHFLPGDIVFDYGEVNPNETQEWVKAFFEKIKISELDKSATPLEMLSEMRNRKKERREKFYSYPYSGPWQFNFRGVDSTILPLAKRERNYWENIFAVPLEGDWASVQSDEACLNNVLMTQIDGIDYITLETYTKWVAPSILNKKYDAKRREFFLRAVAAFYPKTINVFSEGETDVRDFASNSNYYDTHTVLGREFFWSEAYKEFQAQVDKDNEDAPYIKGIRAGLTYNRPSTYYDPQKEEVTSFTVPCQLLVERLALTQKEDGKWVDPNGKLVCYDLSLDGFSAAFVIMKDALINFMHAEDLDVAWGIYTEQKDYSRFYSTRKVAQWDGRDIIVEQFEAEEWDSQI